MNGGCRRKRKTGEICSWSHGVPASLTINTSARAWNGWGPSRMMCSRGTGSSSVTTTIGWHSTIVRATTRSLSEYSDRVQGPKMHVMNLNYRRVMAGTLAAGGCLLLGAVCAAQTPEQQKMWDAQRAQAQADERVRAEKLAAQRAARRADPMAWVRTLNPLTGGGWQFRSVAPDGSWAAFSTEHQLKR